MGQVDILCRAFQSTQEKSNQYIVCRRQNPQGIELLNIKPTACIMETCHERAVNTANHAAALQPFVLSIEQAQCHRSAYSVLGHRSRFIS